MSAGFAPEDLSEDAFLGGRLSVLQPRRGFRAATDAVLLAAAVPARAGQAVLELGCGAGVASLCLGARVPDLALTGLELQPAYAALARANAARNDQPLTVIEGDVAVPPAVLRACVFDHVLCNPPWYRPGGGTAASDSGRERALREAAPLAVWIDCAARRLRSGGRLTLIHEAARLPDVLAACDARLGSLVVLPLTPRAGRPARRVIVAARKGGRAAFRLLAPLVLHAGSAHGRDGEGFAPEVEAVLRDAVPLSV